MKYILVLMAIFSLLSASELLDIPVTRNLLPDEHPVENYQDFLNSLEREETDFAEIISPRVANRGNWLAVVEEELFQELETELTIWTYDLQREGRNIAIVTWSGDNHLDLKAVITSYYELMNIQGVFLLGNLPVFWFELWEDWNYNGILDEGEAWVEFPMDAYFADLDGIWDDLDVDGVYDLHSGEMGLEIAVSRLRADNLPMAGNEVTILHNWFERNNLYRNGITADSDLALGYIDDDWADWAGEYASALNLNYENVEMVSQINSTTANDYRNNRWGGTYEWIQVHVHSGPDAHYFYQNNGNNYYLVYNHQIPPYNPTALFYNLFCCSNARFTQENSMGSLYVLGNQQGLASIGSTKTGSMLEFENFYAPLANGEVMGEALRQWWNSTMLQYETSIYQQYYRSWFYGMVLTGDPTLLTEYEPVAERGDIDYNGYIEAYDASMVIRYSLQMEPGPVTPLPWGAARQYLADTSGDGVVTAYDSALILQYHVGIIDEFPQP